MYPTVRPLILLSAWLDITTAANIFVSHYQGTVQSLNLIQNGDSYTLTANSSVTLGGQPSWMTFDNSSRTIYAADETGYGSASVWSVSAATNGKLTQNGKASAPLGSVHNALYGNGFLAQAHYQTSTISTFKLPLSGSTLQTFALTMPGKGTIPSRQDAAHPHEVIVDPTGKYILVPDLGADLIRLYSIDASTGILTSCGQYTTPGGTGPRHGTFYGSNILYVGNELANTVHGYTVTYPSGCIALSRFQSITTLANNKTAPTGTKVGEVHIKDDFLYASNRRDLSFSPNDSMASFALDKTSGEMTFQQITTSGGTYPRTFSINKAGDLVVIGDQTTANVVVAKRDPTTGKLGAQVASMRIGTVGTAESDNGLSAVLWDE